MPILRLLLCFTLFSLLACQPEQVDDGTLADNSEEPATITEGKVAMSREKNEADFLRTMQAHLDAVSSKDLVALKATMSPDNKMQLILPGAEIMASVDSFIAFHEAWFEDPDWTMETEILNTDIGIEKGIAVTQLTYREPERDGIPYFNRMIVTYGLEKQADNRWYVIMDHASSVEKSTDEN